MARIGVSGHIGLTAPSVALIRTAVRALLVPFPPAELIGVSCVAPGADCIFAEAVLGLGGRLIAIVPAADYRDRHAEPARFDALIGRAAEVRRLPLARSGDAAYAAANEVLLGLCDRVIAVWDGLPSAAPGGTAALVRLARARGVPVDVLWPEGAGLVPRP